MIPSDVIAVVLGDRHEFPPGLGDGVEYASQVLAGQVQDDVVAEGGRPWPELRSSDGSFLGVPEPGARGGDRCLAPA